MCGLLRKCQGHFPHLKHSSRTESFGLCFFLSLSKKGKAHIKNISGAHEMAQWVWMPAANSGYINSIPKTHTMEETANLSALTSHVCHMAGVPTHLGKYTGFLKHLFLFYVNERHVCRHVCMCTGSCLMPKQVRRGLPIPWRYSYRQL